MLRIPCRQTFVDCLNNHLETMNRIETQEFCCTSLFDFDYLDIASHYRFLFDNTFVAQILRRKQDLDLDNSFLIRSFLTHLNMWDLMVVGELCQLILWRQ